MVSVSFRDGTAGVLAAAASKTYFPACVEFPDVNLYCRGGFLRDDERMINRSMRVLNWKDETRQR